MIKVTKETTEIEGGTLRLLDDFLNIIAHVRQTTLTSPDGAPTPETSDCLFNIISTFAKKMAEAKNQEEADAIELRFMHMHSSLSMALKAAYLCEAKLGGFDNDEEDTEDDRGE